MNDIRTLVKLVLFQLLKHWVINRSLTLRAPTTLGCLRGRGVKRVLLTEVRVVLKAIGTSTGGGAPQDL